MASPSVDVELVRRGGFKAFVRAAWPQIEPKALIWEPHLDILCQHYEAVLRGEILDIVVNVPPGTSKSTISSVLFPVYAWIYDATLKLLGTSYDESLSLRFAGRSLRLMCSDWFKQRWPGIEIVSETRANLGLYENTAGGLRVSTMMGGKATGKHADILFADDPHKPDDLNGDPDSVNAVLDECWQRWIDTFSTRRADAQTFRRIVIMQRLHEEDMSGRMLREPGCVHVCLPMEFEAKRRCATKWGIDERTEEGELLCPLRFPQAVIEKDRVRMTPRSFAAQHQQRPSPAEGSMLLREWFQNRWVHVPPKMRMYLSVDANLKDRKDSDYCVIQAWGVAGANYFLIDQVRGRWSFGDAVVQVKAMKTKWPMVTNILIEDKANGTAIIDLLSRTVPGVIAITPLGGKEARADACTWLLRAANVFFPQSAPFVNELIEEAAAFPVGAHDDMVDAMTQFLNWISGRTRAGKFAKAMANARAGRTFR